MRNVDSACAHVHGPWTGGSRMTSGRRRARTRQCAARIIDATPRPASVLRSQLGTAPPRSPPRCDAAPDRAATGCARRPARRTRAGRCGASARAAGCAAAAVDATRPTRSIDELGQLADAQLLLGQRVQQADAGRIAQHGERGGQCLGGALAHQGPADRLDDLGGRMAHVAELGVTPAPGCRVGDRRTTGAAEDRARIRSKNGET